MNCLNLLIESNCLLKTRNYLSARRGAINRKTLFLSRYMPCSEKCKNLVRQACSERTCLVFENDESEKSALNVIMWILSSALESSRASLNLFRSLTRSMRQTLFTYAFTH